MCESRISCCCSFLTRFQLNRRNFSALGTLPVVVALTPYHCCSSLKHRQRNWIYRDNSYNWITVNKLCLAKGTSGWLYSTEFTASVKRYPQRTLDCQFYWIAESIYWRVSAAASKRHTHRAISRIFKTKKIWTDRRYRVCDCAFMWKLVSALPVGVFYRQLLVSQWVLDRTKQINNLIGSNQCCCWNFATL